MKTIGSFGIFLLVTACSGQSMSTAKNEGVEVEAALKLLLGAEEIIVTSDNSDEISLQLFDTGFNYEANDLAVNGDEATVVHDQSAQTCFEGPANEVCDLLTQMGDVASEEYRLGDHDLTSIVSCNGSQSTVTLTYSMVTDYDEYEIVATKEIARCSE